MLAEGEVAELLCMEGGRGSVEVMGSYAAYNVSLNLAR